MDKTRLAMAAHMRTFFNSFNESSIIKVLIESSHKKYSFNIVCTRFKLYMSAIWYNKGNSPFFTFPALQVPRTHDKLKKIIFQMIERPILLFLLSDLSGVASLNEIKFKCFF